ncbi:hypothetical protein GCM10022384_46030 [Streptomyces marokkonensis]|uniref:FMN hydroxy acid dehydrogenase domain-containing protein n=1 Tax=Streptomyces marokkonensis TaxID=324855 RepID=A0ABP7R645_9ACTN
MGMPVRVHPEAEKAAARAAAAQGVPFILSTSSSTPMEEVAEAAEDGERWFQLYWAKDREITPAGRTCSRRANEPFTRLPARRSAKRASPA